MPSTDPGPPADDRSQGRGDRVLRRPGDRAGVDVAGVLAGRGDRARSSLLTGVYAPGVLLASFVPMLLIASAFYYLNSVDQDCGTTFSWVTRAMGPWFGWFGGWAIAMTGVLVIGSLAEVGRPVLAAHRRRRRGRREHLAGPRARRAADRRDDRDLRARHRAVRAPAERADRGPGRWPCWCSPWSRWCKVATDTLDARRRSRRRSPGSTRSVQGGAALTGGLLLGVFAYWGWESAVNLTEETEDSAQRARARPACSSTVVLLVTYVSVAFAVVAYAGTSFLADNSDGGGVHLRAAVHRGPRRLGLDRAVRGRHLGDRLDPDHDHPGLADRAQHGPPARAARRASPTSTGATAPRTCRPGGSPGSRSSGTSWCR